MASAGPGVGGGDPGLPVDDEEPHAAVDGEHVAIGRAECKRLCDPAAGRWGGSWEHPATRNTAARGGMAKPTRMGRGKGYAGYRHCPSSGAWAWPVVSLMAPPANAHLGAGRLTVHHGVESRWAEWSPSTLGLVRTERQPPWGLLPSGIVTVLRLPAHARAHPISNSA